MDAGFYVTAARCVSGGAEDGRPPTGLAIAVAFALSFQTVLLLTVFRALGHLLPAS